MRGSSPGLGRKRISVALGYFSDLGPAENGFCLEFVLGHLSDAHASELELIEVPVKSNALVESL
jgi:hypothetical protein